jgi:hypothetical protein
VRIPARDSPPEAARKATDHRGGNLADGKANLGDPSLSSSSRWVLHEDAGAPEDPLVEDGQGLPVEGGVDDPLHHGYPAGAGDQRG